MANRLTKGRALVGQLNVATDGLLINGTAVTSTAAELNVLGLSTNLGTRYIKVVAVPASILGNGTEIDTTYNFPAKCIVHAVHIDVETAEATASSKLVDVGTAVGESGDPNGLLAAVSVAATGLVKGTLVSTGQTLGALMSVNEDGSGALVGEPSIACGGKSLVITAAGADFAEFAGNIILDITEIA